MSYRPTPEERAAIEAALACFGRDATVHEDGRIHAQLAHCRPMFFDPELSVRALPLANRLHRRMTGGRDSVFIQELFEHAAKLGGVAAVEAKVLGEHLGEVVHVHPGALGDAKRRAKLARLDRFYAERRPS